MSTQFIVRTLKSKCLDCDTEITIGALRCKKCNGIFHTKKKKRTESQRIKNREYMRRRYHENPEARKKSIECAQRYCKSESYKNKQKRKRLEIDAAFPPVNPEKIAIDKLAYAAGIIDGEGSIQIRRVIGKNGEVSPRYDLTVKVSNTNPKMIEFLSVTFGGRSMLESMRGGKHRPVYRWNLVGERCQWFLKIIKPYMVCKQDQVDLAILFRSSFIVRNRNPRRVLDQKIIEFRHDCYLKMKELHLVRWNSFEFTIKPQKIGRHYPKFKKIGGV